MLKKEVEMIVREATLDLVWMWLRHPRGSPGTGRALRCTGLPRMEYQGPVWTLVLEKEGSFVCRMEDARRQLCQYDIRSSPQKAVLTRDLRRRSRQRLRVGGMHK